jgi:aspartyl protease family protein
MIRKSAILFAMLNAAACAPVTPAAMLAAVEPETSNQRSASGHTVDQADDGLFYTTVHVNGTPLRFVVDTGASIVVLTADDARAIGISTAASRKRRVDTVTGSTEMTHVLLDKVVLGSRELGDIDAVVMPRGLKVSLLGQNVLSRLDSVTISGRRLRID